MLKCIRCAVQLRVAVNVLQRLVIFVANAEVLLYNVKGLSPEQEALNVRIVELIRSPTMAQLPTGDCALRKLAMPSGTSLQRPIGLDTAGGEGFGHWRKR